MQTIESVPKCLMFRYNFEIAFLRARGTCFQARRRLDSASPPPEATDRAAHVSAVSFARKRTVRGASFT